MDRHEEISITVQEQLRHYVAQRRRQILAEIERREVEILAEEKKIEEARQKRRIGREPMPGDLKFGVMPASSYGLPSLAILGYCYAPDAKEAQNRADRIWHSPVSLIQYT